ncbi:Acid trehalase [Aspergillus niger]|uniref:beta-N-acetylhexosaminidase n=1 Tax=Aspergillus niger TaxID=5061 RepID=A0A505IJH1_ASPNG|nr:Acid trehalase [Aspergillus niger]
MRWRALGTLSLVLDFTICGFARLVTVPTIPFDDNNGTYALSQLTKIVVDTRHASTVDTQGQTLIPPTLREFAATFQEDLRSSLGINLPLVSSSTSSDNTIFLTFSNNTGFRDVAGRFTAEAYALHIDNKGITISGASPLGVWWGTRSLIQAAVVSKHDLPQGSAIDAPGWETRGVMESMDLYAAFRPWSDDPAVSGLNKRANESYTRSQFDHIQRQCARRGVTIIPEIEAPGHALAIVQWRPELGLTDLSMLNISHPDTVPTMKSIWKTFLPWFHSKTVHLGADEYSSSYVADYTDFVNDMHTYIAEQSDKDTRIWGTFTPSEGANVSKAVTIQHWEYFEDNPYFDYIKNNYSVLNSDDAFYIVGKWSGSYPQYLNKTRVFHGDPANNGPYAPNIFSTSNATDNPPRNNPYVLGHIAALWNDYGPNATTYLEAYYSWRDVLPALADKQWGGDILEEEYDDVFDALHAVIPGQNLDRHVPSKTDLILHYNFANATGTTVHRNMHPHYTHPEQRERLYPLFFCISFHNSPVTFILGERLDTPQRQRVN